MTIHAIAPPSETPKWAAMLGRLMLTMLESSVAMKTPSATTKSTAHLFDGLTPRIRSKGRA